MSLRLVLGIVVFCAVTASAQTQPVRISIDALGKIRIAGAPPANPVALQAELQALC